MKKNTKREPSLLQRMKNKKPFVEVSLHSTCSTLMAGTRIKAYHYMSNLYGMSVPMIRHSPKGCNNCFHENLSTFSSKELWLEGSWLRLPSFVVDNKTSTSELKSVRIRKIELVSNM